MENLSMLLLLEKYEQKEDININKIESSAAKKELVDKISSLNNPVYKTLILKLILAYFSKYGKSKKMSTKEITLPYKGRYEKGTDTNQVNIFFDLELLPLKLGNLLFYLIEDINKDAQLR
jgi:hypothetical protein